MSEVTYTPRKRNDLVFMRFMAICLITNSHIDEFYPFPYLGTGGAIGNALFFFISGYGLALSEKKKSRPFLSYYWRRIIRIYPTVILVVAIFYFLLPFSWRNWTLVDYLTSFIWPTPAPFIGAIMLSYIVLFISLKSDNLKTPFLLITFLILTYFIYYIYYMDISSYTIEGKSHLKWFFYAQIMLLGSIIAKQEKPDRQVKYFHGICLIIILTLYYSFLFMLNKFLLTNFQFIIHLLTFFIVYLVYVVSNSNLFSEKIMKMKYLETAIPFVAGLSLEIYLLQYQVYSQNFIKSLVFPLNILMFIVVLLLLSKALTIPANSISKSLSKL